MKWIFLVLRAVVSNYFMIPLFGVSMFLIAFSIIAIFFYVPDDYLQGNLVKIMYVHVPLAWLSMLFYSLLAISSLLFIITRVSLFDIFSKSCSHILLAMIFLTLATGSIWGKPAWGSWWVWDARLTSMLLLFFVVLSYIIIRNAIENDELKAKISAITAIVGFINIPIIKFSVNIWSTLHQRSTFFRASGPSIDSSMMYPVFTMFSGILILVMLNIISNVNLEILAKKNKRAKL